MLERHQNTLNYAKEHILKIDNESKYGQIIQSIWLFGSCARKEEKYNSDIDIIIIVNKIGDNERRLMRQMRSSATNIEDLNSPEIDVIFKYNNGDKNYIPWNDEKENNDTFSKQLRKDAIKIWERN